MTRGEADSPQYLPAIRRQAVHSALPSSTKRNGLADPWSVTSPISEVSTHKRIGDFVRRASAATADDASRGPGHPSSPRPTAPAPTKDGGVDGGHRGGSPPACGGEDARRRKAVPCARRHRPQQRRLRAADKLRALDGAVVELVDS